MGKGEPIVKRPGLKDAARERSFWPLVTIVLGILLLVLIVVNSLTRGRVDAYKLRLQKLSEQLESGPLTLGMSEIERLSRNGLENPILDLKNDLMAHPELIPYEGVLGGTMGFYSENRIWVLTERWAVAEFDDGHRMGYLFLDYSVENGAITWTVNSHYLM
jgi:hypothetical protein